MSKQSNQKITLNHVANCIQTTLQSYQFDAQAQRLKADITDLQTITLLVNSQAFTQAMDIRKKSLSYFKSLKSSNDNCKQLINQMNMRITRQNVQFAFAIFGVQSKKISRSPFSRYLTELKLKFLESQGVNESKWEEWFQNNQLVLKSKDKLYEIRVGLSLFQKGTSQLIWKLNDVRMNNNHHPQLYDHLIDYLEWLASTHKQRWQSILLQELQKIVDNLAAVMLCLDIKEKWKKIKSDQSVALSYSWKNGQNTVVEAVWNFNLFQTPQRTSATLSINNQKILSLIFRGNHFKGEITFGTNNKPIVLRTRHHSQISSRMIDCLAEEIQTYQQIITKSLKMYDALSTQNFQLFVSFLGEKWLPQGLRLNEQEEYCVTEPGVWTRLQLQNSIICRIQFDLSITCRYSERGFLGQLLSNKECEIPDLINQLQLRKRLIEQNKDFQFHVYQFGTGYLEDTPCFIYQFKAYRFQQNNRLFKLGKIQQQLLHLSNQSNDNFVLIAKVTANFQRIYLSSYKCIEGIAGQKQIPDLFFPKTWKEYREIAKGMKYNWERIGDCIIYLCKYYMIQRSYNRRMTEEQKKMTVYNFK